LSFGVSFGAIVFVPINLWGQKGWLRSYRAERDALQDAEGMLAL